MRKYPHSKPKPPRGWSYPVNRTALDAALEGLDEDTIVRVDFVPGPGTGTVLLVLFTGETSRLAYAAGRVFLQVHTVPSTERKEVERALLVGGLARLRGWLDRLEAADPTWRAIGHSFRVRYESGALVTSEK